jgi:hypothetical protein
MHRELFCAALAALICLARTFGAQTPVLATRTPNGGFQPQVTIDENARAHLIYLKGDPAAADIYYQAPASENAAPIRVNTQPGSAIGIGTIRGPQIAAAHGFVHVLWNGHAPRSGTYMDAPMLYTRMESHAAAFEPERNLITSARGLDGGGAITADAHGNVLAFWHAPRPGNTNGESGRALFVSRSTDDGKSFAPEAAATEEATGACACCGMKAFSDARGNVFAIFRSARDLTNRAEVLLKGSFDSTFTTLHRDPWKTPMCPMSSASFAAAGKSTLVAWETKDSVWFAGVNDSTVAPPITPAGKQKRKYPALAVNKSGEVLLAWAEGTAWAKGGTVVWQLYDRDLKPIGVPGRADGMPAWSCPAAFAKADGTFVIYY